jgi:hypothetical protein
VIPFISLLLSTVPMWLSPIDLPREQALSTFSEGQHRATVPAPQAQAAE